MSAITTSTVISAIWALRDIGPAGWPTRDDIPAHLRCDPGEVTPLLRELKAKRIMNSRRRRASSCGCHGTNGCWRGDRRGARVAGACAP